MNTSVRWGWRLAFTAVWLLLTAWWLLLPPVGDRGETFDVPFVQLSLFQTPAAVVVAPSTDEAIPLRVLRDMIVGLDAEIAELEKKIREPLPPEFRNRGLIKILFGPPSPRRLWLYQQSMARTRRDHAEYGAREMLSGHVDALQSLETEAGTAVQGGRGWAAVCGPLTSFVQPAAPFMPNAVYVARTPLTVLTALGLLPLLAGLVQGAVVRARQRGEPAGPVSAAATASEATLAAAAHGKLLQRPRWFARLGVGLAVTIAGFLAARWATSDRVFQMQLRASDDLRFRVEHNCFLVGHFFDDDWRATYSNQMYQAATSGRPAPALPKLAAFFSERFWEYEPANALRTVSQGALSRGVAFLQDGYQTVLAVGGWVAGLPGLIFLVPIFTGLITEARMARRRRRGVCAACAYPMFGLPEPRCPECGTTEKRTLKAER